MPVPDVPFPRLNDTAEFRRRINAATAVSWVVLLLLIVLALILASWLL